MEGFLAFWEGFNESCWNLVDWKLSIFKTKKISEKVRNTGEKYEISLGVYFKYFIMPHESTA